LIAAAESAWLLLLLLLEPTAHFQWLLSEEAEAAPRPEEAPDPPAVRAAAAAEAPLLRLSCDSLDCLPISQAGSRSC
jgi:hypothetical protein